MTILCEPDRLTTAAVTTQVEEGRHAQVRVVDNLTDAAACVAQEPDQRLVVIGPAVAFIDVAAFADYMHTVFPDAVLVLVRDGVEPGLVHEAQAAGIAEVVPAGDAPAILDACDRARTLMARRVAESEMARQVDALDLDASVLDRPTRQPAGPAPLGQVVTVFSAKGGTGKTAVATNLALTLHASGRRVCLVDLDLEFGDVAIFLALSPGRSLADAASLGVLDAESVAQLLTPVAPRLDCVLAPVSPGDAEAVTADHVRAMLDALRERYDHVVIDTPSQLSERVLEAFDAADHHLLVTTPEIPALKSLRLTLDLLDLLDYRPAARSVLLNRADAKCGITADEAQQALRTPLAAQLPASADVTASINAGSPLAATTPGHPFSTAVRRFADATLNTVNLSEAPVRRRRLGLKLRNRSS